VNVDSTAAPLAAGVALLERAIGYTLGSLLLVAPEDLHRPTPCREWDLAALLAHMNDSLAALEEATIGRRVDLAPRRRGDVAMPAVDALRDRACRLLGEWNRNGLDDHVVSVGDRDMRASLVAATGALEIAAHGWDVAQACGHPRAIPPLLSEELLDLSRLLVPRRRGTGFAPAVHVDAHAPPSDRLVGFLGRVPTAV
jgi:uncharacterized protein (TIGR03086 family)